MRVRQKIQSICLVSLAVLVSLGTSGCGKMLQQGSDAATDAAAAHASPTPASDCLYITSGAAYAGNGVVPAAPSLLVSKFSIDGKFEDIAVDVGNTQYFNTGDTPVGIADFDSNSYLVAIENTATTASRKIIKVRKDGTNFAPYIQNSTAFSSALRHIAVTSSGVLLTAMGTSTAGTGKVEAFSNSGARILIGANPFVSAPAGACATSTYVIPGIALGPSGHLILVNAAATPNNQIDLISKTGYSVAADCLAAQDGPSVNDYPTDLLYHSSGKLLVSYSNTTGPINRIYSYDVTASSIASPVEAYNDLTVLQGISSMVELPDKSILVAAANPNFNTVERFTLNASTGLLTRVGNAPFLPASVFTRSVSAMMVAKCQ